jgi:excisionase family DNA binding protein
MSFLWKFPRFYDMLGKAQNGSSTSPSLNSGDTSNDRWSLMGVKELAEYLQVDVSTVYLWSQRGQIPAMKVGKMWRYRRSEIEGWLDQRHSKPSISENTTAGTN